MTIRAAEQHLHVRLVAHTHWDREWYRPEPQFRQRLVALVDGLLDRVSNEPFLLDGQAVLLEDYLGVRPERASELSAALRRGAVEAGPWYVLADELIPSGEGLVRNLLAGRRVLQALRAAPPDVLYCPDSFGHPAALPAIARGFGCETVVLWRGYGGRSHPPGDTARWHSADGTSVLLYHLPPDGYEFGAHLPADLPSAAQQWEAIRLVLAPRATTGLALLPCGADHHDPAPDLDRAIVTLAAAAAPTDIRRTTLAAFGAELREREAVQPAPAVQGELRDSYGYAWTLQGTLGARAAFKRAYAMVERDLIRDTEPWVALAHAAQRDRRHLLRAAWRPVLLCQPHDTLCGCSVDDVARDAERRLAEGRAAASELRHAALTDLLDQDPAVLRRIPEAWRPVVVVRNRAARLRSGVAAVDVDIVLSEAPVGPGSAGVDVKPTGAGPVSIGNPATIVQELARELRFAREESPQHYPRNRLIERRHVLVWVREVPGYGVRSLPLEARRRRMPRPEAPVASGKGFIDNGLLRIGCDGAAVVLTSAEGRAIGNWMSIEAEGERGDLYTPSPVPGTGTVARLVRSRLTLRGPLRAELTLDWTLPLKARRLSTATGVPRIIPAGMMKLRTRLQLDAGASFVRVVVSGANRETDLSLRLVLRTGVAAPGHVFADAAFGPVERVPIDGSGIASMERPTTTAPLHRFVSMYDADGGATLFSDGLAEYEARDDSAIAVTLLRAVGELSRHDLSERPGHAGYPTETPDAQQRGPFEATFAFHRHGPRTDAQVQSLEEMADDVLLPLTGSTWRAAVDPPLTAGGISLSGEGLAFSAAKTSEDGEWVVLRCVNLLGRPTTGAWQLARISEARRAQLDEVPVSDLGVRDGVIDFSCGPREIVTVLVR